MAGRKIPQHFVRQKSPAHRSVVVNGRRGCLAVVGGRSCDDVGQRTVRSVSIVVLGVVVGREQVRGRSERARHTRCLLNTHHPRNALTALHLVLAEAVEQASLALGRSSAGDKTSLTNDSFKRDCRIEIELSSVKSKFHLARHVTSRLDTFDVSRRACRARKRYECEVQPQSETVVKAS